jgi:phage terminase small subunit
MPLTPKQHRFVTEYLIDLNATQAAIRCGYSERTAKSQGSRLLTHADVAAAIADRQAKRVEKLELTAERVLQELARLALVDVRGFFDERGDLKPLKDLTPEQGAALQSFEVIKKNAQAGDGVIDTVHKIRLWDKTRALELLAKHFALLVERVQVSGDADLLARLTAARKRTDPLRGDAGDE